MTSPRENGASPSSRRNPSRSIFDGSLAASRQRSAPGPGTSSPTKVVSSTAWTSELGVGGERSRHATHQREVCGQPLSSRDSSVRLRTNGCGGFMFRFVATRCAANWLAISAGSKAIVLTKASTVEHLARSTTEPKVRGRKWMPSVRSNSSFTFTKEGGSCRSLN